MTMRLHPKDIAELKMAAKMIAIHGYRNSPIEDIHAEGRISDAEMKHLNKTICNQIYTMLYLMRTTGLPSFFTAYGSDWDEPELLEEWLPRS